MAPTEGRLALTEGVLFAFRFRRVYLGGAHN
jgi:hypothetical protein